MGIAASHHRRTLSSASYQQVELDEVKPNYQYGRINQMPSRKTSTSPINYATTRMRSYENVPFARPHDNSHTFLNTSTNEHNSTQFERPDSLPFDIGASTKLRSSLRKYSSPSPRGTSSFISQTQQQQQQQQLAIQHKSSPTKTPSDSLTSDDSSYLSARDGSNLSISNLSKKSIRFSPETLLEQPPSSASVNTPLRRLSRSQRHSISDMLAPGTS